MPKGGVDDLKDDRARSATNKKRCRDDQLSMLLLEECAGEAYALHPLEVIVVV